MVLFRALINSHKTNATFQPLAAGCAAGYLQHMLRFITAFSLSLTLALTSYSMAVARGQSSDIGTDMVICTGVGMITMTIGADGEPVETAHVCPDAMSIFGTVILVQEMPVQMVTLQWRTTVPETVIGQPQETLAPLARGPPLVI